MKLFRILSVNLGLPAMVPLLVLAACSSSQNDDATPTGGTGGLGVSGAGTGGGAVAGTTGAGGATAGATSTAGSGGAPATAGSGGVANGGGGSGGAPGSDGASAGNGGVTAGSGGTEGGSGGTEGGSGGTEGGSAGAETGGGGASAGASGAPTGGTGGGGEFTLTTPAFENKAGCAKDAKMSCDTFPPEHTNFGNGTMKNVSPELNWTGAPAGTQSFAILLQDLSNGQAHWVIWNLPGSLTQLPAGVPGGAMPATPAGAQQASFAQNEAYFGPGAPCNVYEFVIYALSQAMISPPMADNQNSVRTYIQGLGDTILGQASIRARSDQGSCN